jgi:hypothetical protein
MRLYGSLIKQVKYFFIVDLQETDKDWVMSLGFFQLHVPDPHE